MWGIFKFIGNLFNKAQGLAQKAWKFLNPFIQEFYTVAEQQIIASFKDLAVAAVAQIAQQGLPTTEEKQKAFSDAMRTEASNQGKVIKDQLIDDLRQIALRIYNKSQE